MMLAQMLVSGMMLAIGTAAVDLKPFPDFVKICHDDADLSLCMQNNYLAFVALMKSGNEEFQVVQLEPFFMEKFLVQEKTQSNGIQISASDIWVYNTTKFDMFDTKCQFGVRCTFYVLYPNLSITGTYKIDGTILGLPLKGTGPMSASFDNVRADVSIEFGQRMKNGVAYGKVTKMSVLTSFKDGYMKLENLFNGDKVLGDAVNDVINSNIVSLSDDFRPIVDKAFSRQFKRTADQIIRQYTIEQLFPKN